MAFVTLVSVALFTAMTALGAASQERLASVMDRGYLICGVNEGLLGFAWEVDGDWTGLDVDFCRAVSAAIFDDPKRVRFEPLTTGERLPALAEGQVDVLARSTTWTLSREAQFNIAFVGINFFDGQGIMVKYSSGISDLSDLSGETVCVQDDTTTYTQLKDVAEEKGLLINFLLFDSSSQAIAAYLDGDCAAFTTDVSGLYAERAQFEDQGEHFILPNIISKEPLGPAVKLDDAQWFTLVKWVHFAMINAEELGVTQETLRRKLESRNPAVRRLLGVDTNLGKHIGLDSRWVRQIIRHVGNYGEVFRRNLGDRSRLDIRRGVNQLWTRRGLQYAPPVR